MVPRFLLDVGRRGWMVPSLGEGDDMERPVELTPRIGT